MTATVITHGNALAPYREVHREVFHTEFAALLFGSMFCPTLPPYHYWVIEPSARKEA